MSQKNKVERMAQATEGNGTADEFGNAEHGKRLPNCGSARHHGAGIRVPAALCGLRCCFEQAYSSVLAAGCKRKLEAS